jgi:hypothetical protein
MVKFRTLILVFALQLAALVCLSIEAIAADIRPYISDAGSYREIVIEGPIKPGDFETFIKIIRENQGQVSGVTLYSSGGNFYEAMKIGRALRTFQLHSQAPMRDASGHPTCDDDPKPRDKKNCTCASACFFIHIGGAHKGGTFLAVHRPYFEKGEFGNLSEEEAKKAFDALQDSARAYMEEMGVPKHIQEDVLGTPSDRILILDDKTIKTYFWGGLPYLDEWKKNKCSRLSDQESKRMRIYSSRMASSKPTSTAELSKQEWADFGTLQKKQQEEMDCEIAIDRQNRIAAYEKYFHVKPSDTANHNFSKWSSATNYLGRNFYEILSEEKFDDEVDEVTTRSGGSHDLSHLTREATANAPLIVLSDVFSDRARVVTRVGVTSPPNPSPEFIRKVVATLEAAWGKCSSGDGSSKWRWMSDKFMADLKSERRGEGHILTLHIDARR